MEKEDVLNDCQVGVVYDVLHQVYNRYELDGHFDGETAVQFLFGLDEGNVPDLGIGSSQSVQQYATALDGYGGPRDKFITKYINANPYAPLKKFVDEIFPKVKPYLLQVAPNFPQGLGSSLTPNQLNKIIEQLKKARKQDMKKEEGSKSSLLKSSSALPASSTPPALPPRKQTLPTPTPPPRKQTLSTPPPPPPSPSPKPKPNVSAPPNILPRKPLTSGGSSASVNDGEKDQIKIKTSNSPAGESKKSSGASEANDQDDKKHLPKQETAGSHKLSITPENQKLFDNSDNSLAPLLKSTHIPSDSPAASQDDKGCCTPILWNLTAWALYTAVLFCKNSFLSHPDCRTYTANDLGDWFNSLFSIEHSNEHPSYDFAALALAIVAGVVSPLCAKFFRYIFNCISKCSSKNYDQKQSDDQSPDPSDDQSPDPSDDQSPVPSDDQSRGCWGRYTSDIDRVKPWLGTVSVIGSLMSIYTIYSDIISYIKKEENFLPVIQDSISGITLHLFVPYFLFRLLQDNNANAFELKHLVFIIFSATLGLGASFIYTGKGWYWENADQIIPFEHTRFSVACDAYESNLDFYNETVSHATRRQLLLVRVLDQMCQLTKLTALSVPYFAYKQLHHRLNVINYGYDPYISRCNLIISYLVPLISFIPAFGRGAANEAAFAISSNENGEWFLDYSLKTPHSPWPKNNSKLEFGISVNHKDGNGTDTTGNFSIPIESQHGQFRISERLGLTDDQLSGASLTINSPDNRTIVLDHNLTVPQSNSTSTPEIGFTHTIDEEYTLAIALDQARVLGTIDPDHSFLFTVTIDEKTKYNGTFTFAEIKRGPIRVDDLCDGFYGEEDIVINITNHYPYPIHIVNGTSSGQLICPDEPSNATQVVMRTTVSVNNDEIDVQSLASIKGPYSPIDDVVLTTTIDHDVHRETVNLGNLVSGHKGVYSCPSTTGPIPVVVSYKPTDSNASFEIINATSSGSVICHPVSPSARYKPVINPPAGTITYLPVDPSNPAAPGTTWNLYVHAPIDYPYAKFFDVYNAAFDGQGQQFVKWHEPAGRGITVCLEANSTDDSVWFEPNPGTLVMSQTGYSLTPGCDFQEGYGQSLFLEHPQRNGLGDSGSDVISSASELQPGIITGACALFVGAKIYETAKSLAGYFFKS